MSHLKLCEVACAALKKIYHVKIVCSIQSDVCSHIEIGIIFHPRILVALRYQQKSPLEAV